MGQHTYVDFKVTELSWKFLTIPYLWGGTSDFGFDCSGMVQRLYRFVGKEIPRNADQQRDFTETVPDFDSALPGDLVFFNTMRPGMLVQSGIRGYPDRDSALKALRKLLPYSVVFFRAGTDLQDM